MICRKRLLGLFRNAELWGGEWITDEDEDGLFVNMLALPPGDLICCWYDTGSGGGGMGRPSQDRDIVGEENSDFGVYICEARNQIDYPPETHVVTSYDLLHTRRYIKLNPNGPPMLRAASQTPVSSSSSQHHHVSSDDLTHLIMKTSPAQIYSLNQVN